MDDASGQPVTEISGVAEAPQIMDSAKGPIRLGLAIVVMFFGVFGVWAALAPLDGAIVGEGVVTVEGNRKSIEHLEGGIVKEIRVKDGDHVKAGAVLVVLDDARLRAQVDILAQQLVVARATEARLVAELDEADSVTFPAELLAGQEAYVKRAVTSQTKEFETRKTALAGAEQVLEHRINDLKQQIAGMNAQRKALEEQIKSIDAERLSLESLLGQGLTTRARMLDLERSAASLAADLSSNLSAIASAEQNIAENQQQISQLGNDRRAQIAGDLDMVQSKILDLGPSLANAQVSLERTIMQSPYEGKVVGLKVFSTGAVLAPGGTILDIVPDQTKLVVQAKIRVEDISDLQLGTDAEVHFTSYKRLYVPILHGRVTTVSADRLTDERTGAAYFLAQVVVDQAELRRQTAISLYPGMPAQVLIATEKRSALEYLLGPLFASFDSAFRQN